MGVQRENCCGCFTLKHGTIIIGVVQSILAFMGLILCASYAEHPHELINMADESVVPSLPVLRAILITYAVVCAVQCLFCFLLIFGAAMQNPKLLVPWLIFNPVGIIVYLMATLVAIIHHAAENNGPFVTGHMFAAVSISLVGTYKIIIVYSYYKQLKSLNF